MHQCETFSLPQARSTVWRLYVNSAPEKPRRVLIGLQTKNSGNQEKNAAIVLSLQPYEHASMAESF